MASDLTRYLTGDAAWPPTGREAEKLATFVGFARDLAELSTCSRLRVGCVIVTPEMSEVLAVGYNGPPAGLPNDSCRGSVGSCGCAHAEANALVKLSSPRRDLAMLLTASPCERCAGMIANCGRVRAVIYGDEYRDQTGVRVLGAAGVAALKLP